MEGGEIVSVRSLALAVAALCVAACGRIGYQVHELDASAHDAGANESSAAEDPVDASADSGDADDLGHVVRGGVTVSPFSGLVTSEAGAVASFTMVLDSAPTSDVMITLASSDSTEGVVTPSTVTFTPLNWNAPQVATVTGVDDVVTDGNVEYQVVTGLATSLDPAYAALDPLDVSVTNVDDESAGVTVSRTSGLTTSEAGGSDTFTVALNTAPTGDVTIGFSTDAPLEATVAPATLTFTMSSWASAQTITVTGVDDSVRDGNQTFNVLSTAAVSSDSDYAGLAVPDVSGTNYDDETPGILVTSAAGLFTSEAGANATFFIALQSEPTAMVAIVLASSDPTEGAVSVSTVTFTPTNWNVAQAVEIRGVDDSVADGDQHFEVTVGPATSADAEYDGQSGPAVSVTNLDNETAGFDVAPMLGLVTTEAGGSQTFSVVLRSSPTADVTFSLSSNDATEGAPSPTELTFTSGTWDTPQTVTVTGIDDAVADGDQSYEVVVHVLASADADFAALSDKRATLTNTDDESAGVTVSPLSGLATTEIGGSATFTVVLNSEPITPVTIGLSSDNLAEGTVSPASLVFTSVDWNVPQLVTVTGVDDLIADGTRVYHIITANAASSDPNYSAHVVSDVTVTNIDDDTAGIAVVPTSGLHISEAGGTGTFAISLTSQPMANVTIALASLDTSEGTITPASLTFTSMDWNTPQSVTVTGVDDAIADGDVLFTVATSPATSSDANYSALDAADVSITNDDNDSAGVIVMPTMGLSTTEAGGTAMFSVVLTSQPTANVSVSITSSDASEGVAAPASLTFTGGNWSSPQIVIVTGVDDALADGNIAYTIVTGNSVSSDTSYSGMVVPDVQVTNVDLDSAGVVVTPTAGLVTTEGAGVASFTVQLTTAPLASVSISLVSSDTTEGTVSPASVTFTAGDWNIPQTVTLTGVDDAVDDGDVMYTIVTGTASSTDGSYGGIPVADVSATNADNDTAGALVMPTSGLVTSEAGGTATFTVTLQAQPSANVSISLMSNDATEGSVSPASITFTSVDWSTPQTVTVTGVDDLNDDGDTVYSIVTGAAASADLAYAGLVIPDVSVTNMDNDTAGVTVMPTSGLVTTELGGTAMFTMVLQAQPMSNVTIALASSDATEGSVSPASITFTNLNWNMSQTVTVTGINDSNDDGDIGYTVVTGATASADSAYSGLAVADVTVTNIDNDTAGVTVSPTSGLVTTEAGGTATFTVVLLAQPLYDVSISIASGDATEGSVSPGTLTFTSANWSTPQTVTVTGVDDLIVDYDMPYTIVTGAAMSSDVAYSGFPVADVSALNTNDEPQLFGLHGYMKPDVIGSNDWFGYEVVMSADGNTLAVSAVNEDSAATGVGGNQADNSAMHSGAVYVFVRVAGVWSQQAYIKASNTDASDSFGGALALSQDGNTLAVGAAAERSLAVGINGNQADNTADWVGAVYVFTRSGASWSQEAYVKASNSAHYTGFGNDVALSADGNTLAVGCPGDHGGASGIGASQAFAAWYVGAAFVFVRSGVTWSQQEYIKASNADPLDNFGYSVALSADGNTLAVSAVDEDSNATGIGGNQLDNSASSAGAVYVFVRSGTVWSQQAYLKASNTESNDNFGGNTMQSISLSSDGNTLAAAAWQEDSGSAGVDANQADNSEPDSGAVYIFTRSGAAWTQQAYIKATNPWTNAWFGYATALSASGNMLVVGASREAGTSSGIGGPKILGPYYYGAAYVFRRVGSTWTEEGYIKAPFPAASMRFGNSVALSDDASTLAVAAYFDGSSSTGVYADPAIGGGGYAGGVYVYNAL